MRYITLIQIRCRSYSRFLQRIPELQSASNVQCIIYHKKYRTCNNIKYCLNFTYIYTHIHNLYIDLHYMAL